MKNIDINMVLSVASLAKLFSLAAACGHEARKHMVLGFQASVQRASARDEADAFSSMHACMGSEEPGFDTVSLRWTAAEDKAHAARKAESFHARQEQVARSLQRRIRAHIRARA